MRDGEAVVAEGLRPASFARRLAAMTYDAFLLAGLLVLASALVTLPIGLSLGVETADALFRSAAFRWLFFVYCVMLVFGFHLWFWTHGGQTLGMRSWRIRVVRADGAALRLSDGVRRWLAALLSWLPLGLGFLWSLFDSGRLAWHDRLSGTRLVFVPKAALRLINAPAGETPPRLPGKAVPAASPRRAD